MMMVSIRAPLQPSLRPARGGSVRQIRVPRIEHCQHSAHLGQGLVLERDNAVVRTEVSAQI